MLLLSRAAHDVAWPLSTEVRTGCSWPDVRQLECRDGRVTRDE